MRLFNYIKETRSEMKHVSWPTRKQAISYTILVTLISIFIAAYLGVFDYIFTLLIEKLI